MTYVNGKLGYEHVFADMLDLDEVQYELRIRGISGISSISESRNALRNIFRESDPVASILEENVCQLNLDTEHQICSDKLDILLHDMADSAGDEHSRKRIRSRLAWLWLRVERNSNRNVEGSVRFGRFRESIERLLHQTMTTADSNESLCQETRHTSFRSSKRLPTGVEIGGIVSRHVEQERTRDFQVDGVSGMIQLSDPRASETGAVSEGSQDQGVVAGTATKESQECHQSQGVHKLPKVTPELRGKCELIRHGIPRETLTFGTVDRQSPQLLSKEMYRGTNTNKELLNGRGRGGPAPSMSLKRIELQVTERADMAPGLQPNDLRVAEMVQGRYKYHDMNGRAVRAPVEAQPEFDHYQSPFYAYERADSAPVQLSPHGFQEEMPQIPVSESTVYGRAETAPVMSRGHETRAFVGPSPWYGNERYPEIEPHVPPPIDSHHPYGRGLNDLSRKRTPVSKWGIEKFDGDGENLPRFLSTVKELAMTEGYTKAEVFRDKIYLFTGDAADFIRESSYSNSWDELVVELTEYCFGTNSDNDLMRRIERKKQGLENCAIYCTRMELAFKTLRILPSEQVRANIILRGMKQTIKKALAGMQLYSVRELRAAAQRVEQVLLPSEDEDDYGAKMYGQSINPAGNIERERRSGPLQDVENHEPEEGCFRCGNPNHFKHNCKYPPGSHWCYKCGKRRLASRRCQNC